MPNYKEMYLKLFNGLSKLNEDIIELQKLAEEKYIASSPKKTDQEKEPTDH